MRSPLGRFAAAIVCAALILPGCARDNGLPRSLTEHLKARGIIIQTLRASAPMTSRGGFVVARYDAQTAARIVSGFALERLPADGRDWRATTDDLGVSITATEVWGVTGRPVLFKLTDGGQLEYFYLMVTSAGEMYLCAEYAYG